MEKPLVKQPKADSPMRSLILAGGGVRVAYQAGVIMALAESGRRFDHLDGTSGGIFNTAMLASGLSPDEIAERWRKLKLRYFVSLHPLIEYLKFPKLVSFGSADSLRRKLFPALGIKLEQINKNPDFAATFNVCNFSDKTVEAVTQDRVTEDHLVAGVSLPIAMPAVKIGEKWYSDAVWIKDANLLEAVKRGSEEIWLMWVIGNTDEFHKGPFRQYVHMIEMSANGSLIEEIEQIKQLNEVIGREGSPFGQSKPVKLFVIKPEFPIPLDPDLFLNRIDTTTLINMGYADALAYLQNLPENGEKLGAETVKMKTPSPTLCFRNQFEGSLRFDETEIFLRYRPAFELRKTADGAKFFVYSSIYLQSFGREIPTFDNTVELRDGETGRIIFVTSRFVEKGRKFLLEASFPLGFALDWFLGLEFKRVQIKISSVDEASSRNLLDGQLYQSIGNRLKSRVFSSVRNFSGQGLRFFEKVNLLRNVY